MSFWIIKGQITEATEIITYLTSQLEQDLEFLAKMLRYIATYETNVCTYVHAYVAIYTYRSYEYG